MRPRSLPALPITRCHGSWSCGVLVFIAAPNNPTGTTNTRAELDAYFERVPPHVLTVLDQAYFEYLDEPDYPEGISEYLAAGHRVLAERALAAIEPLLER